MTNLSPAEAKIRAALEGGDRDAALTLSIRAYGSEILGFIQGRLRDTSEAQEAFAWFAEDLWRSLPTFARHCSMRTWAYALARNATSRFIQRELNPRRRRVPLSRVSRLSLLIVAESTPQPTSGMREQVARLKAQLSEEEQTLLTLRIDRDLPWKDVAQIIGFGGEDASDDELKREAIRLRQRFHVLKARMRELVQTEPSE